MTDYFPARKPTSCRNKPFGTGKQAGGKRKEADALPVIQLQAGGSKPSEEDDTFTAADVPMLSSQDAKLSRSVIPECTVLHCCLH